MAAQVPPRTGRPESRAGCAKTTPCKVRISDGPRGGPEAIGAKEVSNYRLVRQGNESLMSGPGGPGPAGGAEPSPGGAKRDRIDPPARHAAIGVNSRKLANRRQRRDKFHGPPAGLADEDGGIVPVRVTLHCTEPISTRGNIGRGIGGGIPVRLPRRRKVQQGQPGPADRKCWCWPKQATRGFEVGHC